MNWRLCLAVILAVSTVRMTAAEPNREVARAVVSILAVKSEGEGSRAAAAGWQILLANSQAALFPTLEAFDQADPIAANWLRSAVDGIVQEEQKAGRKLPLAELTTFVKNSARHPDARRIAYELLASQDTAQAESLLAGLTNDPSSELRRDAIAFVLKQVDPKSDKPTQATALRKLFAATRDKDQAEEVAERLEKVGVDANLTQHFGYVTQWHIAGPFDSTAGKGFLTRYEPEKQVDLKSEYTGKDEAKLKWVSVQSDKTYGTIDLNKALSKHMDAAAYAVATIVSPAEQPAEVRVTSKNAIQIFLNGKLLFGREAYHQNGPMDGHIARGMLKQGPNEILIKVLQNNQKESWAQAWDFAARVCDRTGGRLELTQEFRDGDKSSVVKLGQLSPTPTEEKK